MWEGDGMYPFQDFSHIPFLLFYTFLVPSLHSRKHLQGFWERCKLPFSGPGRARLSNAFLCLSRKKEHILQRKLCTKIYYAKITRPR